MYKKAKDLEFISQIKRDGSGVTKVTKRDLKFMLENDLMKHDKYLIRCLSMSENTYIAMGFNSFVVKLKE
jgi:hypothetical protein